MRDALASRDGCAPIIVSEQDSAYISEPCGLGDYSSNNALRGVMVTIVLAIEIVD